MADQRFYPQELPGGPGNIARARSINQANPNLTFFTPGQALQALRMQQQNNPLAWLGDKAENFLQLKQIAQQLVHGSDPRTRAGLLNDLSMFVGGRGGDASPMMGELGMPGQFRDYGGANVHPLERGLTHEGPNPGAPGAGMRGLVRRAEGVNPLRRPDPEKVAEAKHAILEKQVQSQLQAHRAMQAVKMRRQLDQHLGSAPMHGFVEHPAPEHDYFTSQEFGHHIDNMQPGREIVHGVHAAAADPRVELVKHLVQRRYQAQLGHNHLN